MSQENLEIVRRSFEAFNRGDLDAAFEDFAPDFSSTLRGRSVWTEAPTTSPSSDASTRALLRSGSPTGLWRMNSSMPGRVVVPFTNRLRGRDGIEVPARGTWLGTIRDGLVVRICLYQDKREALEAAGLSE